MNCIEFTCRGAFGQNENFVFQRKRDQRYFTLCQGSKSYKKLQYIVRAAEPIELAFVEFIGHPSRILGKMLIFAFSAEVKSMKMSFDVFVVFLMKISPYLYRIPRLYK